MKIALFGYGKMGKRVAHLAGARGHHIVSDLGEADAAIDFSVAEAVLLHVEKTCATHVPLVIGTTGWEEKLPIAQQMVTNASNAALYAPNFSLGVALFRKLLKEAAPLLAHYEISGCEWHHATKQDAPSGTAKAIQRDLVMKSPFASVREGEKVGTHTVTFDSQVDQITLTHEAKSRDGFALGAIQVAEWIHDKTGWFTLDDMLHSADYALR